MHVNNFLKQRRMCMMNFHIFFNRNILLIFTFGNEIQLECVDGLASESFVGIVMKYCHFYLFADRHKISLCDYE